MAQKIIVVLVILIIIFVAYQFIKVHILNATLDRELFSVLSMYKKRMDNGAGMKPKIEDMRRDAYEVFKKMDIPIKPDDIDVEVNFEQDYLAFRAKYPREINLIFYTYTSNVKVEVILEIE
ncbi:MAG: hypothetical protein A2161_12120 [Candidatus Schekmanbacteria bacterium RBG_13_48_7]|uniref:DUF4845 domain-containing protein n=1 Tax=Candidatus Schekmanbacteria bacterium RBG_13_48_7 TaxID=1817878 RepID=A0A1F7RTU7_9BACT|nr:MAG: hypothetical protein A2161_12120 [Candidatus Schekmanbacteria bacterium RBG_13_48_7]